MTEDLQEQYQGDPIADAMQSASFVEHYEDVPPAHVVIQRMYNEGPPIKTLSYGALNTIQNGDVVRDKVGNLSTAITTPGSSEIEYRPYEGWQPDSTGVPTTASNRTWAELPGPTADLSELEETQIRSAALEHTINMFKDQTPEPDEFGETLSNVLFFLRTGSVEQFRNV
jgi:hypothetical protein